ncbi:hypothetical protein ZIOFF_006034 [Zingiber officinale]|uniref:Polyprotein n=1 Tax=Zingiber officinale TaxID=94328 RepID=A0A8J5LN12_ZINOF|nr:hypothetical protein ZIOFF_006034 [Zingiber officinale]
MSTFVTARNIISYREAVSATDSIETPSFGFAKPSDFQGVTPGIAVIIKQNNTEIHLLTQIAETLKEIQQELRKQNTPLPQDLISKLQNLSLGPPKPKEKPGKLRVATTPLFEDQIRSYRRNQRRLYNTQQAARRIRRQLTGGGTTRYTLEQQLEPEAQLQLSMQERASIVPAEVLYHSRRDDAHHRVYVHRSEEAILVTDNHQVDRNIIQEESFTHLQRSRMQYVHLGVLQVRIQILHRQYEGTMALVVFRDNRWQGDQAILATMEVDLTRGSQMIYVIPEVMMTIGDFYRNIQISILTRGYEDWQNSEANLLITRGMVGRLSNTPNVGFAYEVQGVVDYLTSHGVNALPGRRLATRSLQGLNWVINPTQISIPMQPAEVNSQTMMDEKTHEQHLQRMLGICQKNGLILSPTKMKIAVPEIEFLGAIIGNCRIKLQPHVITKIADFNDNELKTTKGMRSWLGLLNYARNYIPNLGKLLGPLYAKTSPNGERKLNQQDWDLIHQLKVKVRQLPDLEIPPPECYMILEVDGCMDGWGGICKWKKKKFDPVSSEKICAYSSGKFNPPKSTIDAEPAIVRFPGVPRSHKPFSSLRFPHIVLPALCASMTPCDDDVDLMRLGQGLEMVVISSEQLHLWSMMLPQVGAAVAVAGLAAYRIYAARKNTSG